MNIFDYAKYYKDYNFDEILFNQMDALIFSMLAYLPVSNFERGCNISNLMQKLEDGKIKGAGAPISIELMNIIESSRRFANVEVANATNQEDTEVQFGAITFRTKNSTIVAYQGTNSSIIGWIENFMLTSEYPTKTQKLSINYLNSTITKKDKNIYVVGHSKGGNLAMTASMEADEDIFSRINKIYNFDGPGFREKELNTDKFKRMNKKTINIKFIVSLFD